MTLSHAPLQRFSAVVEEGSISAAAARLGVSQPALSASIRQLETTLGLKLLSRGRHGTITTPPGAMLYERAKRVESELVAAEAEITALAAGRREELAIGAVAGAAVALCCAAVARLMRTRPHLALEIEDEPSEVALLDKLSKKKLSIVLCPEMVDHDPSIIRGEELFRSRRILAVRSGHPICRKGGFDLADVLAYPFVHLDPKARLHQAIDEMFRTLGFEPPKRTIVANSIAAGLEITKNSDAFSIFSELSIASELKQGVLKGVPMDTTAPNTWNLFWSRRGAASAAMCAFAKELVQVCRSRNLEVNNNIPAFFSDAASESATRKV